MPGRVIWYGDRLHKAAIQAAIEVARQDADIVKGDAVNQTPLEFGPLRGSANVDAIEKGSEISFNTKYALVQHEKQFANYTTPGTGPGYLRQPLLEFADQYQEDVNRAMKAIFG
ncbi:MAG: Minor capsid protein [Methanosaeta sp. PtaB.Bin039]|nr:MAG: Minor capsid protein [Methanosaeta sp. PtaB.Bin039]